MRRLLPTAYCLLLIVTASCAYVPRRESVPVAPAPLTAELAAYYRYPHETPNATIRLTRDERRVREYLVQFPLAAPDFTPTEPTVEFEWFESTRPGRRPAILFNPILGGDYPLERGVCRYFARRGFHVALIHRKTLKVGPDQPVSHLELLLRQGILRIRQVVDWMERHDRVDPQRMGNFGISMGGMASVMAAAIEPRLRVHVVALAGGGLADILVTSHDPLLTKPRRRYLARNHLDLPTLHRLLHEGLITDPLRLAPYVDTQRLLMMIALADRTIGQANALRLWRALGRPRAIFLPTGHYTSYFFLPYIKHVSLRFFQRHLALSAL